MITNLHRGTLEEAERVKTVRKKGGKPGHKNMIRAQLRVRSLREAREKLTSGPELHHWWTRWDVLVPLAITIVLGIAALAATVPSLLPKISVTYEGPGPQQNVATFKISNDGVICLNNVSATCRFVRVTFPNPTWKVEDNTVKFAKNLDRMPPGGTVIVICPFPVGLPELPTSGLVEVGLSYRPDFGWFRGTLAQRFESAGDLVHWTPPHLF
jgi:hypothetical protein